MNFITKTTTNAVEIEAMADETLLSTCIRYGTEARNWRNKFLGMLPEINRRKLYERKSFLSIFHFAEIVGGVSEEQVSRALNLDNAFENMPALKSLLENGEASISKIARIASIATAENQEELAEIVKTMPMSALKTMVKDIRCHEQKENVVDHKPENNQLFGQEPTSDSNNELRLDVELKTELLALQKRGINVNQIIREALEKRKQQIEKEKEVIGNFSAKAKSRYIPKVTRDLLKKEYGNKCSIGNCNRMSATIHHSQRFALSKTHDPRYLAPLCKDHHVIAHSIDLKYRERQTMRQPIGT